jgi:hypothetical protein
MFIWLLIIEDIMYRQCKEASHKGNRGEDNRNSCEADNSDTQDHAGVRLLDISMRTL